MYFNSRPHEEVDFLQKVHNIHDFYFNSRPHEEVDPYNIFVKHPSIHFNSRPHEEVDDLFRKGHKPHRRISTHDLTKRSTVLSRSTMHSQVKFQLTTSRRGRPPPVPMPFSFSIFQLTTSRRGRLLPFVFLVLPFCISTHDLTKRSTGFKLILRMNRIFQLTTSRRGRPSLEY